MDSKHEQIGTRGNTEKKICEITPPHVSQFVRSVRSDGGRERERLVTGQEGTRAHSVSLHCLHCPLDGSVGTDKIVLVRKLHPSSSEPEPDGGSPSSREQELYLGDSRSCCLVLVEREDQLWTVIPPAVRSPSR